MKVNINEIKAVCENFLVKIGIPRKTAIIIFADYLEGELLNKKTHGLGAFVSGVYDINRLKKSSNINKIKIVKHSIAYALINGHGQAGQLVAEVVKKILIKKAKKCGIAMVGTYNARAILRPGSQAEALAQHDLIGVIFHNGGGPLVAPYGGIDPVISTDPIGFAIPTLGLPIVADMAISMKAWREIEMAKLLNKKLPSDSFIDEDGVVTLKPEQVFSALPFGGYKGFALGILSEILTGSLVNSGLGLSNGKGREKYKNRGALYIAIDPSKFVGLNKFKKENSRLVKELKQSRMRPGFKEIVIPGELAYKNKALCLKRGWFEVDKVIIDKIYNL